MANLSNINDIFKFTDGEFLLIGGATANSISGTETGIAVSNSNAASLSLQNTTNPEGNNFTLFSNSDGSFIIRDVGVGDRFSIDEDGDSNFAGSGTFGDAVRINATTTTGLVIASSSGASNGLKLYNNSSTDNAYIYNHFSGKLEIGTSNATVLTMDGTTSTFVGQINLDGTNQIYFVAQTGEANTEAMRIVRSADTMFFTYGVNANEEAFSYDSLGVTTFAGKIIGQDSDSVQLELKRTSSGTDGNTSIKFVQPLGNGFFGVNSSGALSFGTAANLITDNKFKVDRSGNGTFAGSVTATNFIGTLPTGQFLPLTGGTLTGDLVGTNVAIGGAIVANRKLAIYNTNADNELQFIGTDYTNIYSETDSTMAVEVIGDGELLLKTKGGNLTIATGGGAAFTGTVTAPRIGIPSSNASFALYNDSNSYFNGAVTVDSTFTQTGGAASTFSGNVLINKASNPTSLQIGSSLADDPFIVFQTDGNTMSMGIDRGDSNKFKISDNATLGTNDRLSIDTSGNSTFAGDVGIGGAPSVNFEVNKSGARMKMIDGTNQLNMGLWDGSNYRFEGDANRPMFFTSYQGNINFGISGGTTMAIQNGKVGIGNTAPQTTFHTGPTINVDPSFSGNVLTSNFFAHGGNNGGGSIFQSGTAAQNIILFGNTSSTTAIQFFHSNISNSQTAVGSITTSSSATTYGSASDYRLKENLQDFEGLDIVSKISIYDFKWKIDESRSYGVMAHELQEVLPQAVVGEKDAKEMQQVDYSKIVPLLVKSIQEQQKQIKELQDKSCTCNNCNCDK